jgi:hypothetical protein
MRKIKFTEKDLFYEEDKQDGCVACATGLNHEIYENFMEDLEQELKNSYKKNDTRSGIIKNFIENYSKAELAFLAEQLITQKLFKNDDIGFVSRGEEEKDSEIEEFKNLLKNSLDLEAED